MHPGLKSKLLWATAGVLGACALALAVLAFILVKGGAYPPEGTGSLGHVGMVIAGLIAGFLALLSGLFAVLCVTRVKAVARELRRATGRD